MRHIIDIICLRYIKCARTLYYIIVQARIDCGVRGIGVREKDAYGGLTIFFARLTGSSAADDDTIHALCGPYILYYITHY